MITIITGTPGSGKTLYAVHLIFQWLKEGRKVYADIEGLNIEGVELAPDDWRTTPEGSIIVYDEAQQREMFKKTRGTLSENQIIRDLEIHRHTGHDIVFITQSPIFMHTHIRELVGNHFHLHRPYGAKLATVYFWRLCQNNPNSKTAKSVIESSSLFTYKKELFNFYKSATVHTHSLKIPRKLIITGLFLIIAPLILYYLAHNSRYLNPNKAKELQVQQALAAPITAPMQAQTPQQTDKQLTPDILDDLPTKLLKAKLSERYSHNLNLVSYNPLLHVSGVIKYKGVCKAFNHYGEQITMSDLDCQKAFDQVTPTRESQDTPPQINYAQTTEQPKPLNEKTNEMPQTQTPHGGVVVGNDSNEIALRNKQSDQSWQSLKKT